MTAPSMALAAAMALAVDEVMPGRAPVAPPSKRKPAEVERRRAKAKAARQARKAQRRRTR
jgi:hypothetical protein